MKKTIKIYEGEVVLHFPRNFDGSSGVYINGEMLLSELINKYKGRKIKVTIEEVEE